METYVGAGQLVQTTMQLAEASQDKLEIAQYFIRCYSASRQGLARLGILRLERSLQGDYAEWLASELLGLTLAPSGVQKGFDATAEDGSRVQVKSRVVKSLSSVTSFDFHSAGLDFDVLVCIFFSPLLDVLGIIRVPSEAVGAHLSHNTNSFRFRWNTTTAHDPRVERLVWPEPADTPTPAV